VIAPSPRRARSPRELEEVIEVRIRVFCDEQGVDRDAEVDGLDDEAIHLVALERGKVIATCRLRLDPGDPGGEGGACKLERLAVDKEFRGRGIGRALVEKAAEEAFREGAGEMVAHAQTQAREFYERAGYAVVDPEPFMEDGIEHVKMSRKL
jgi:predicted GNAT family N-acyltransferase